MNRALVIKILVALYKRLGFFEKIFYLHFFVFFSIRILVYDARHQTKYSVPTKTYTHFF